MKLGTMFRMLAILAVLAISPFGGTRVGAAESVTDAIEVVRSAYAADRQALLAEALQLTETQAKAFWPIYREERLAAEKLGDELVKLVLEYADAYPSVTDDQARRLLKQMGALEKKLTERRARYLKRASGVLPPAKVLRLAQIENRFDLVLRLQIASLIPLAPGTIAH